MPVSGKLLRRVLAFATIAIAARTALVSLAPPLSIPGLFAALGFFIPGGWWFYCESKDKKARATHQQRVQAQAHWNEHLDPVKDQAILAGLGPSFDAPQPFRRRWGWAFFAAFVARSEEHTSELQSRFDLVCRLLLDKKNDIVL